MAYDDAFGYWFSGFSDGESCFHGRMVKSPIGSPVIQVKFSIRLRADDHLILEKIMRTLGVGKLKPYNPKDESKNPSVEYAVDRCPDLRQVIIPHFEKYPLHTKKSKDFAIWKRLVLEYRIWGKQGIRLSKQTVNGARVLCEQLKQTRVFRLDEELSYKNEPLSDSQLPLW